MSLSLLLLPLMLASVSARFVNVTIDDTHGDARTGLIPAYSPEGHWNAICPGCGAVDVPLDWAQVEQRTIHDAVVNSTIGKANVTLNFNGSAIYVFFAILPMFDMQVESYLDSSPRPAETYIRLSNTTATDVIYDHLVFKSGTLADAEHTLLISCAPEGNFGTIALFDYALYTVEDADPVQQTPAQTSGPRRSDSHGPSTAEKGVIAGAVVGVSAVLAVVAGFLLRRRHHRASASDGGGARSPGDMTVVPFPGPEAQTVSPPAPKDSKLYYRDAISPFRAGSSTSGSSPRSPKDGKAAVRSATVRSDETEGGPSVGGAPEDSPSRDTAYLRAELERMHAENAMLRQVSEPPPYDPRTALDE